MALDRRNELLRGRAMRALGKHQVASALAKFRAIIGPSNIPDSEPLAQNAMDKLEAGETPTADEITALEIVVRLLRPVLLSRNGEFDDLPDSAGQNLYPQELADLWSAFRTQIKPLVGSIGRVETRNGKHVGTGFLVAEGLVATNRHVLGALTFGSEVLGSGAARVVFKQEVDSANSPADIVRAEGVAAIHPTLDIVLLTVSKQGRRFAEMEPVPAAESTHVATIGYPGDDQQDNPLFLAPVFNGKFGFKGAALGEVLDGSQSPSLFHDCSTTRGNSGSPVFSLTTGRVVGIHRAGFFMYRNEAVSAAELDTFVQTAKP